MIRTGAGLRGDGRDENQVPGTAAECGFSECRGGSVIDLIIQVVAGKSVSNSSKMNDDIALLQQRLPIERHRQIRKRDRHYVRGFESGRRPRRRDHLVALRSEIGYEVAPNEAVRTGYEHSGLITHLSVYRRELTGSRIRH